MIITYIEEGISKQREANAEEVEYLEAAQADAQKAKSIEEAEKSAKAAAKQAVYDKLGLTADEVQALLA